MSAYTLYTRSLKNRLTRIDDIQDDERRKVRSLGQDWPPDAETMIGLVRLENIQYLIEIVESEGIPGDVMECGVWKGGATILMAGVLEALDNKTRRVWVADSFQGLPKPNPEQYPVDQGDPHHTYKFLAVSQADVQKNFERYSLMSDRVQFLPGFFKDSLPGPVEKLAVLRVDADMYESTTQALEALYPKVSPQGFVIIDDYYNIRGCHEAVEDFRKRHEIDAPLVRVDWSAAYWRKL